jgi:transmembrane sensor
MNAPATPPDWDAIARYLSGESSVEEAKVVHGWLEANPVDRALLDRLDLSANVDPALAPADVDVEAALARVHQRMREPERPRLSVVRGTGASRSNRGPFIIGALAAAAATFAVITVRMRSTVEPAATVSTYETGVGKTGSVTLADGSRITLGPQSRLSVPSTFSKTRIVDLTGDAYFDVKHDASRPFAVRTASARIEDIGTSFTVESDEGEMTSVSVVTGTVRLRQEKSAANSGVVLNAGDRGRLDPNGNTSVERQAVREEDTAWVSGRLAFRDAPLSRVAAEIERWYGVKVRISDSALAAQHVTTSFEGESADQALKILGLTVGAKIERHGDSAIVSPNRGPATSR